MNSHVLESRLDKEESKMNSKEIFNFLVGKFEEQNIEYVILHSYQNLPERFDSDIDIATNVEKIVDAIELLDKLLKPTG